MAYFWHFVVSIYFVVILSFFFAAVLFFVLFLKKILFIFIDRGEGRDKERERNINVWLPLMSPLLGTWLATRACALTGNWTDDPLVPRLMLNPLSYTSQCIFFIFTNNLIDLDILSMSTISHYWLLVVEARGAAKHLPMHKTAPQ